jgi:hypothetical protein
MIILGLGQALKSGKSLTKRRSSSCGGDRVPENRKSPNSESMDSAEGPTETQTSNVLPVSSATTVVPFRFSRVYPGRRPNAGAY